MAIGAGKYDEEATLVRLRTKAKGSIVFILEGIQGTGFSVQATAKDILILPEILRSLADQIEKDMNASKDKVV